MPLKTLIFYKNIEKSNQRQKIAAKGSKAVECICLLYCLLIYSFYLLVNKILIFYISKNVCYNENAQEKQSQSRKIIIVLLLLHCDTLHG